MKSLWVGLSPLPVTVTTRIVPFLVGNPYKPSFPLSLGGGATQFVGLSQPEFNPLEPFLFKPEIFFEATETPQEGRDLKIGKPGNERETGGNLN